MYIGADGYQIPSAREVVNKAMFVYNCRSPIDAADVTYSTEQQLLFHFMNFTCGGNITSLMFILGSRFRQSTHNNIVNQQLQSITSWPYFSLLSLQSTTYHEVMHHAIGPTSPDQI